METAKMKIVNVPVDEITPYENNPRINEGAVEQLARIIEQLGFRNPAVLNKDKVVIEGHTRLLAVKKLGWETMPCIIATDLTPEQEQALRIADNKIAEIAEWDDDKLKVELAALQEAGFDLSLLAFGDDELEDLLGDDAGTHGETEPDAVPETPEVPVSTPGEVYRLGRHILVCGDSTQPEDVAKACGEGEADLWLTDPPYNVDYHGSDGQSIRNDSMEDTKFREFLRKAFGCAEKRLKPGGSFYVFHADSEGYNFRGACFDVGLKVRQCLVWKKNSLVLGRQDYKWIHELLPHRQLDQGRRRRPRHVRRKRLDRDSLREVGAQVPLRGTRPQVLRRDTEALGGVRQRRGLRLGAAHAAPGKRGAGGGGRRRRKRRIRRVKKCASGASLYSHCGVSTCAQRYHMPHGNTRRDAAKRRYTAGFRPYIAVSPDIRGRHCGAHTGIYS